ncbi:FYN-binding protein 1 [Eucyclogobius newberryi]|uniref:FYN-binding protein 1 n=1 Tax=Eucyclogobius newberryi TaxID=166745 RepID=UPI003B5B9E2B
MVTVQEVEEESVDVKALRSRFTNTTCSSGFPRPLLKPFSPISDTNDPPLHRLSPTAPGQARATPPTAPGAWSQPGTLRAPVPLVDTNKVRQTGELLQNMMLRHQRPQGARLSPVPALSPGLISPSASLTPAPPMLPVGASVRPLHRPRSIDNVAPLRKPLPAGGPRPPKPKRPAHVNLDQWRVSKEATHRAVPTPPGPRCTSAVGPPRLPQRDIKPGRLPRQITLDIDEDQETYDDIGSLEKDDSWREPSHQRRAQEEEEEEEDIYQDIDANQKEQIQVITEMVKLETPEVKPNKKDLKRQQEQEKKEQQERQRREEQLRKNFQLQSPVEVLHTASVRQDWSGSSKLDLSVRQGDRVDIVRVKNNPEGKWLARSASGNCGYISNTCVDIDYEAIKRRATQIRRMGHFEGGDLPPPPPDPPGLDQRSLLHDSASEDDDKYDDVDFPPPPLELNIDPKIEKELKKKFKFEGPLKVLQTMMVDPNALIKKVGPKDLSVSPGDVLDVLQLHNKKALCRDRFGKFGYVNRSHLLSLDSDIYDDVEYPNGAYSDCASAQVEDPHHSSPWK